MEPALSAAALDMIGGVLGSHQKYNDAIPYFRRARDLYYEKRDIYPGSVVATSNNLALLLMKQGKYAEAIRVLEKAEPSANAPTFGAPKFKQVLYDRLAILSEKTGDKAAAERYRKKFNESLAR
ncbi:MAG TPA: tetratricopeptide repeat protein [Candidatus Melainabacteria bacterium]|nr:tetratricopeptide repeat protein [Candidatus Melainabacteria bacterium]